MPRWLHAKLCHVFLVYRVMSAWPRLASCCLLTRKIISDFAAFSFRRCELLRCWMSSVHNQCSLHVLICSVTCRQQSCETPRHVILRPPVARTRALESKSIVWDVCGLTFTENERPDRQLSYTMLSWRRVQDFAKHYVSWNTVNCCAAVTKNITHWQACSRWTNGRYSVGHTYLSLLFGVFCVIFIVQQQPYEWIVNV